ncbi:MAG TPA: hypothetical protein DCL66_11310 [Gammaproteobacteria bacterium]|nr:hypothetical protein [Gammaproteobacteria bacterium]
MHADVSIDDQLLLIAVHFSHSIVAVEVLPKTLAYDNIFTVAIGLIQSFRQHFDCSEAPTTLSLNYPERLNYELLGNRAASQIS